MKACTIATTVALLASSTFAAAVHKRDDVSDKLAQVDTNALVIAAFQWHSDTAAVSAFLDNAAQAIASGQSFDLTGDAQSAFGSETNEKTQKGAIEGFICLDSACDADISFTGIGAAKIELEGGAFQSVLDQLNEISSAPEGTSALDVANAISIINNGNSATDGRCAGVLPAIDLYFRSAADVLKRIIPGDTTLDGLTAARPAACNGISALSQVSS
ncbi:hypothetical protein LTR17_019357 [Elasticomyces elasticus]|nr:hypothetical protein LTR17_019357 [Elasticomyces elasticus]